MTTVDPALQVFIEESRELLEGAESTLLALEDSPEDPELVNALFRAVHTIKGSAGLFGFDDVMAFTHLTESVMGRLRDGELQVTDELLTLFLQCRDHISMLVEHAIGEVELAADAGETETELRGALEAYLSGGAGAPSAAPEAGETAAPGAPSPVPGDDDVQSDCWHISLRFGPDALRNGMDPLSFLRYLATVGDIEGLTTVHDTLPLLADMHPERCYLGFEIELKSEADKATIEDVFEFLQDDCVIHILPPRSHISEYIRLIDELPEERLRIGEILVMSGTLTPRELSEALRAQAEQAVPEDGEDTPRPVQPLGEVVVEKKLVSAPVVDAAVDKQKKVQDKKSQESQVVRVNAEKLESLINLVGELVIAGANTKLIARRTGDDGLKEATENMSRLVEEIRDTALGLRMVPIGDTFSRFRRVVRELSRDVGKQIELKITGGDTELDKTVVEKISDPLLHLIRNSIDHGVETPAARAEAGKPARAAVALNAYHESGSVIIEVVDDGAGLPRDKILAKAIERGLTNPSQELSDQEIFRLIFEPGFSTAEQVTNISGRGVGMDVVRRNIDALRGQVDVESTPGQGTTFIIRLPLTLAIIDGFQVRVGRSSYVIPLDLVDECIELNDEVYDGREGANYIKLRGEALPFVRLGELFAEAGAGDGAEADKCRDNIVVVHVGGRKTGLVVDALLGEHQTVIKPLGPVFQRLRGISGATILGSGEVAMILDVPGLVDRVLKAETASHTGHHPAGTLH